MADDTEKQWHVDRRVPIPLLLAIGLQTAGAIWWASGINQRVAVLEKGDGDRSAQTTQLTNIAIDMAALKEKTQATNDDVSDIKRSVEMLTQQVLQEKTRR